MKITNFTKPFSFILWVFWVLRDWREIKWNEGNFTAAALCRAHGQRIHNIHTQHFITIMIRIFSTFIRYFALTLLRFFLCFLKRLRSPWLCWMEAVLMCDGLTRRRSADTWVELICSEHSFFCCWWISTTFCDCDRWKLITKKFNNEFKLNLYFDEFFSCFWCFPNNQQLESLIKTQAKEKIALGVESRN